MNIYPGRTKVKQIILCAVIIFSAIIASGCDDSGALIGARNALAEIQATLPANGMPAMDSVMSLYQELSCAFDSNSPGTGYVFTPGEIQYVANMWLTYPSVAGGSRSGGTVHQVDMGTYRIKKGLLLPGNPFPDSHHDARVVTSP
jgi:hypothetical protein